MGWMHKILVDFKHFTGYDLSIVLAVTFAISAFSCLYTRVTSGNSGSSSKPPSLPYWTPFVGHLPQWLFDYDVILEKTRNAFSTGISTLNLGGEPHHIISSRTIAQNLEKSNKTNLSDVKPKKRILRNVFGVPKDQLGLYHELVTAIQIPTKFHLEAEMQAASVNPKHTLLRRLEGNIADLISFNADLIDHEPWEKVSNVKVSEDQTVAEVSLLPLVFLFLTHIATHTLVTDSLLLDEDHLETGPLLLAFIQSYSPLMSGLPRWTPSRILPGAHITRRRLLTHLDALLDMTEDPEMQNDLLTARSRMLDDHKAPRPIRRIELLRLLHGLNIPHVLAFWMLLHIVSDLNLLEKVREEATKVVTIVREKAIMGFSVPPQVKIDTREMLSSKTRILQKCWLESARLYSRGQRSWTATEDFELQGSGESLSNAKERWQIKKDDWIDVPYWHANTDVAAWEEPERWDPNRHDVETLEDTTKVFLLPGLFGMDDALPCARLFALAFVACAVLLYDFEVDEQKGISTPTFAAGVALPESDVRVRIRKRNSHVPQIGNQQ